MVFLKCFNAVFQEEHMMSKDKYPSIFSPQMEAIVFIILQIFLNEAAQFCSPFLKLFNI